MDRYDVAYLIGFTLLLLALIGYVALMRRSRPFVEADDVPPKIRETR